MQFADITNFDDIYPELNKLEFHENAMVKIFSVPKGEKCCKTGKFTKQETADIILEIIKEEEKQKQEYHDKASFLLSKKVLEENELLKFVTLKYCSDSVCYFIIN